MSQSEFESEVGELSETEVEAVRLLQKLKISVLEVDEKIIHVSPFEMMILPREVGSSRYSVALSRTIFPDLLDQLKSGVIAHSTSRGIVCPSAGHVELALRESRVGGAMRLRRLSVEAGIDCSHIDEAGRVPVSRKENHVAAEFHIPGGNGFCVEISPASPACLTLTNIGWYSTKNRPAYGGLTAKVYMPNGKPEQMEQESNKIIASLLYELDVRNNVHLRTDRWIATRGDRSALRRRTAIPSIRFPELTIKPEMSTLFGFAASATDNPPLAFLSYYQILEHHLTFAVKRRALRKLGKELSDPLFNRTNRDDLLRIFMIGERATHMSESAQLKTLIDECVRPEALANFFSTSDQAEHFSRGGPISGVDIVNLKDTRNPLGTQVADRIYGIRNRIVHAKDDPRFGEVPPLLPESQEADALWPDIMLARLLATEVILDSDSGV
ncbi:hypothetical protein ACLZH7_14030 [Streptomyces sp. BG2AG]|uniref:hypothetical protein n=1 Tax=unclassified Streptomyces TaxID=2593676 RepID=UPI0039EFA732